jgi:PBSX family phage portal protein
VDAVEHLEKSHDIVVAGLHLTGTTTQKPSKNEVQTPENALEPPVNLDALAKLSQINSLRRSIIDAIATNVVGLGYGVDVAEGHEEEVPDPREAGRELSAMLEALAMRDTRMDRPSFTQLMKAVKTDEEEVGWGFIEVSRNKLDGKIDGLFHCPGKLMRRLKDRSGYVLLDEQDKEETTTFYNFGEKVEYDSSYEPTGTLAPGHGWNTNEVICFRLYTSESRDYGLPRDVGAALEYAGDKLAAEYNVSFFDAGGTPPTLLFIRAEGEDQMGQRTTFRVPQQTVARIANTIKSDTGHRDRVAIIPLPQNSAVDKVTLGEIAERDMGFVKYRADNTQRILSAFRMQPIFVGLQSEGRYDAEVQRSITLEQLFDPEQDRYEDRLRGTLLKDLGFLNLKMKFKRMAVESDSARRESAQKMAEAAAINVREFREAHGYGPLPEAPEGAVPDAGQYPAGINDRLVNTGTPRGAENRNDTSDQRGLRPGLADRVQRSTDNELATQHERQVTNGGPPPQ